MKKGKVYLLSTIGDDTYYKIGFTTSSTAKRVKQLQTGNVDHINIVCEYETTNYLKLEKMLHLHFSYESVRGEWFYMNKSQVESFLDICKEKDSIIDFMNQSLNPFF